MSLWTWLFGEEPTAVSPPMVFFSPTKDFFSDQFRSQYTAGLVYQASAANAALLAAVHDWEQQGLVTLVRNDRYVVRARLQGKGII